MNGPIAMLIVCVLIIAALILASGKDLLARNAIVSSEMALVLSLLAIVGFVIFGAAP